MPIEIKMVDVFCRCGLAFKVNVGNPQKWHAKSCQDFYEDKERLEQSRAWRRENQAMYKESKIKKKWGKKCLEE